MLTKTISPTLQRKAIPGSRSFNHLKDTFAFRNHPLQFLAELQKQYGDIARFRLLTWPIVFINHPDYIKHVLQDNHRNYDKDVHSFQIVRPLVGNGLVTAVGGKDWLRQRRLVQPAFHHRHIAALAALMTDITNVMLQQWDTYACERQVFDVAAEMTSLTLQIVSKSLFSVDVGAKTNSFCQAFSQANTFLINYFYMSFPPLFIHTPRNRRFWLAIEKMDAIVYEIIHNRRQQQKDVGDLLSMLLSAVDENGQKMDDKLLRDEIMTLLLAGHETVASTLTWTWYLLTQHPEAQEHLHAELDQILAGRVPTMKDLPQLNYTRMVLEEAMRLYPPVWQLMRRAIQNDEIDGYYIPANSYILWSPYVSHRHPDFWEKPEQFYPEHFSTECSTKRPRHAYMPFSSGPRVCIGNTFAVTEAQLVLATIAQRYRISLAPRHRVEPELLLSLRPKNGVLVSIERR
jgi:cytochrome P450